MKQTPLRVRASKAMLAAVLVRQGGKCALCQQFAERFEFDHHLPVAAGGETAVENLRALCVPCHRGVSREFARSHAKAKRLERENAAATFGQSTVMRLRHAAEDPPRSKRALRALLLEAAEELDASIPNPFGGPAE